MYPVQQRKTQTLSLYIHIKEYFLLQEREIEVRGKGKAKEKAKKDRLRTREWRTLLRTEKTGNLLSEVKVQYQA